jgi:tRNA-specific 2-thiouridylase
MQRKPRVLVAMSGGVDSSVAAALLKRQGYDVVGCFMRLGSPGETLEEGTEARRHGGTEQGIEASRHQGIEPSANVCDVGSVKVPRTIKIGHQGCCSITDAADARAVAAELDVPFYVCNFKKEFGRVIDYFVDEYANGRTPNPCVRCNDWLKFGKLHEYAKQIGAEFVASGHYARVTEAPRHEGTKWRLMRGVDGDKDQSYVLFGVPRELLGKMLLPIGGMEKSRVRELAREFGLPVHNKPDSQEICFVPDNDYAGLVERKRPGVAARGEIRDEGGRVVGTHEGQHKFTIGQRRGLSLSLGYPVYVTGKSVATNTVTVGTREGLMTSACEVGEANWLCDMDTAASSDGWIRAWVKYRYNTDAVRGRVRVAADGAAGPSGRVGRFEVEFDEAQAAVAPGQALVVYSEEHPDIVLGGGWIGSVRK